MQKTFQSRANRAGVKHVGCKVRAVIYARNHRVEFLIGHTLQINFNAICWRAVKSPRLAVGIIEASVFNFAHKAERMSHTALLIEGRGDCHFVGAGFKSLGKCPKPRAVYPVVVC